VRPYGVGMVGADGICPLRVASRLSKDKDTQMIIKIFGYLLASAALFTSLAMALMGARWQAVERSAYAGQRRPLWFIILSILLVGVYLAALATFIGSAEKSWAGWLLMVVIPLGWALKAALVIFNP